MISKVLLPSRNLNSACSTKIRIRVNFYNQTKTIIGSQDYIIYENVPYGSTQTFSLKVNKPSAMATYGWTPTGATYY